jgi:glycosyltransferase involved in cell wall biosynthesis
MTDVPIVKPDARPVSLSVVVPAHNSSTVIERTVIRLARRLADRSAEIVVVENGSSDDTLERCRQLAERWDHPLVKLVVTTSQRGLGNALHAGVAASRGASILLTADDLPFGFDDLDATDRMARTGGGRVPAIVIGSKAHQDSRIQRPPMRGLLSSSFAFMRRWILASRVGDSQGTFLVDGTLLRNLVRQVREPGFLFTTELVYLAEQAGIEPVEIPVSLRASHRKHPSRITPSDVASMGLGLIRIRWRHRRRSRRSPIPG